MKFTETMLKQYAEPLSSTEEQKCRNAINMVRDALKNYDFTDDNKEIKKLYENTLAFSLEMRSNSTGRKIKIFVQGSYANGTNVKANSDVDIAIILESNFKTKYRVGIDGNVYGFGSSNYGFKDFKNDVQQSLEKEFGADAKRKNKSIKINGNTYRTDTDAVPALRYRDYSNEFYGKENDYIGAIYILTDDGTEIINYPEQHIINGKKKNNETNYYYKKMVRIAKKIRYLMQDSTVSSANKVSSFGIESLLWNIPSHIYIKYNSYGFIFDEIINYLIKCESLWPQYKEANDIKSLFSSERDMKDYISFLNDLKNFYNYDYNG